MNQERADLTSLTDNAVIKEAIVHQIIFDPELPNAMVVQADKWELDDDITHLNSFTSTSVYTGLMFSHPVTEVSSRMKYP